ncbi:DUF6153 family protein [Actinocorallia populi]|uniref:DUF6153 family protein n=1 Tax=Actinocorallia populi TaxID=2079200 RepID=UPI0018E5A63A|nr:DUF6153 family protein [Actinocorallia populi]
MTGNRRQVNTLPTGGVFVLLALLVTAGLVGMHGLTASALPAAAPAAAADGMRQASHSAHAATAQRPDGGRLAAPEERAAADSPCSHHSSGDHAGHSVADCAATGVGTAHLPPAPPFRPHAPAATAVTALQRTSAERAPPDLARLQLLRI